MRELICVEFPHPGLHTSIQDFGRPGHQAYGIPLGGVLDKRAAMQANHLVSNPLDAPLLEITLLGPKIEFHHACQIAITGANLSAKVNGNELEMYQTINIKARDILRFGKPMKGCRTYLAIGGEWQVKKWMNSASLATVRWEELTPDSKILKGQKLFIKPNSFQDSRRLEASNLPELGQVSKLKLLPGPEFEQFDRQQIAQFFGQVYTVTPSSNRMGYRLSPALSDFNWKYSSISSGVIPGTVQITNGGDPIILLADAQTVGGYPRIGNLMEESLNVLAQLRPGDQLRFEIEKLGSS